jgi:arabinofuranosyltransferase
MKSERNHITWFFLVFMFILLLRTAWVSEDTYITLRTVDNFINGYGLTWNISERVQAYTHPFWMFLLSGLYFFTREGFYTSLALSIGFSLAAFWLVIQMMPRHNLAIFAGLSVLFFSKAYVDFSTSGLENPGTHFLLACFLWLFLQREEEARTRDVFWLTLIAALATLNRMDTLLFFIPALLMVFWQKKSWATVRAILLGFSPFILWEFFSVLYYGFPFPNTAYAKLHTGLGRMDLLEMGYLYFLNSLHWDPITLFMIAVSGGAAFYAGTGREKSIALGVVLYLFYVIWIGADYMSGRFFTGALLVAVILFNRLFVSQPITNGLVAMAFVVLLGMTSPTPTLTSIDDDSYSTGRLDVNQISDERSFFFQPSGLLYDQRNFIQPYFDWVFRGTQMRIDGLKVAVQPNIGFVGYFAGPKTYIIDTLALADPLLARLTPFDAKNAKPGHYERAVPEGYFESVKNDQNRIQDESLAEYYEKIRILTRGPIWNWERFLVIWQMNTGQYEYLLKDYESRVLP